MGSLGRTIPSCYNFLCHRAIEIHHGVHSSAILHLRSQSLACRPLRILQLSLGSLWQWTCYLTLPSWLLGYFAILRAVAFFIFSKLLLWCWLICGPSYFTTFKGFLDTIIRDRFCRNWQWSSSWVRTAFGSSMYSITLLICSIVNCAGSAAFNTMVRVCRPFAT